MAEPDLNISKEVFMQHVEQLEGNDAEKKDVTERRKEILESAKGANIDTKLLVKVVALRKRRQDDIDEEEHILDVYKRFAGLS